MTWPKHLATGAVFLGLAGCSSILGLEDPEVSVGLSSEVGYEWIGRYQVTIGGRTFRFTPRAEVSKEVEAPESGVLPVTVTLQDTELATLATAEFTQRFRDDSNHWVVGRIGLRRPIGHCIGQLVVLPLPQRPEEPQPDTLFLMHGSIPEGAVC